MTARDRDDEHLVGSLLAWYDGHKRDLPWRRRKTPYRVWLAETMLQQTRVETVVPYYRRFLRRFPSMASLARAPLDDVLEVWAGLGYYSRARNLHAAAREVVGRWRGRIPRDRETFLGLPGVGPYTAGAVLSIAYDLPLAVVDGNVTRVLCRLYAIEGDAKSSGVQNQLRSLAGELVPDDRPGDFNQALMELGSLVCVPQDPACPLCPLADRCEARATGRQDELPRLPKRKPIPHYDVPVGIIWRDGKLLITKRPTDAMLGGLWEFPGGKRRPDESLQAALRREIGEETGLTVEVGEHIVSVKHAYSHFRVTLHAYHCRDSRGRLRLTKCEAHEWVEPGELDDYAFPSGSRAIIQALQAESA
ncbi:MAG: A/G-specific adenine glycosylase [Planctomycetota bacterium]